VKRTVVKGVLTIRLDVETSLMTSNDLMTRRKERHDGQIRFRPVISTVKRGQDASIGGQYVF
jgi:hypothetical protein